MTVSRQLASKVPASNGAEPEINSRMELHTCLLKAGCFNSLV